jgi:hypothetical protein
MDTNSLRQLLDLADAMLALSDPVWNALIAGVVTLVIAYFQRQANQKLDGISKTGESVHLLVNSSMSNQLRLTAVVTRRLAGVTKDPTDAAAATLAEKLYHDHAVKQSEVDARIGKPAAVIEPDATVPLESPAAKPPA